MGRFLNKLFGITPITIKTSEIYYNMKIYERDMYRYLPILNNESYKEIYSKNRKYLFTVKHYRFGHLELNMLINKNYQDIGSDINLVLTYIHKDGIYKLSINPVFREDLDSLNIINEAILLQIEETREDIEALSEHKKNILAS